MKELSIEQKAKAYDEAIERAKSKIKNDKDHVLYEEDITDIFPVFKESEDEKIRQFLIHEVAETSDKIMSYRNMNKKDVLAWLEKQGEQKPTEWSEEDDRMFNRCIKTMKGAYYLDGEALYWLENRFKSLIPQNTWKPTEEQMKALDDVISSRDVKYDVLSELWKDLKKLREE